MKPILLSAALATALIASCPPESVASQVWVVAPPPGGPGVDFTDLQSAADAAADGDTILVRPGTYFPAGLGSTVLDIDGKALHVVGDGPGVEPRGAIVVHNLAAGQNTYLRGIDVVHSSGFFLSSALVFQDNAGSIWVEEGVFRVGKASSALTGDSPSALSASNCAGVTIVRCDLDASGVLTGGPVIIHPLFLSCTSSGTGGDGLVLDDRLTFPFGPPVITTPPTVHVQGCTFTAGPGGQFLPQPTDPPGSSCPAAADGSPTVVTSGSLVSDSAIPRSVVGSSPARFGDTATLTLNGQPGDAILWIFSALQDGTSAGNAAPLVLGVPFKVNFLGFLPAGGVLQLSGTVPSYPGIEALYVYEQILFVDTAFRFVRSSPTGVQVLSGQF